MAVGVMTLFCEAEGYIVDNGIRESLTNPAQSETSGMSGNSAREPGDPIGDRQQQAGPAGEGNKLYGQHVRRWGVGRTGSTCEALEQRGGIPGGRRGGKLFDQRNSEEAHTCRTQGRERVSQGLGGVREAARRNKNQKFTALLHHVTVDLLRDSYNSLKRKAGPGVDGVTWQQYGEGLEERLRDLHDRVHRGAYHAQPSRRTYIPKADGRQRPLGIAALEDKIVQQAVVTVLNAIYEEDFLGFSYGFRPGRRQHDALDALWVGLKRKRVNWVLDLDVRGFFDNVWHEWLVKFIEHRIADRRILRLIQKWLKAGVSEEGEWTETKVGTPQGQ
jgi:RNA-directed DNA polymerase